MPTTSPFSNSPTTSTMPMASKLLAARFQRVARPVVDDVVAARPRGQADPALAGAVRRAVGQEQRADRLAGQDPRQRLGLRSPRR